jgi:hypothetical protein
MEQLCCFGGLWAQLCRFGGLRAQLCRFGGLWASFLRLGSMYRRLGDVQPGASYRGRCQQKWLRFTELRQFSQIPDDIAARTRQDVWDGERSNRSRRPY